MNQTKTIQLRALHNSPYQNHYTQSSETIHKSKQPNKSSKNTLFLIKKSDPKK